MKKFLGILLMSVLVGGAAFAQLEIVPTGSAKLSWGIDLGKGAVDVKHGFYNENKFAIDSVFQAEAQTRKLMFMLTLISVLYLLLTAVLLVSAFQQHCIFMEHISPYTISRTFLLARLLVGNL